MSKKYLKALFHVLVVSLLFVVQKGFLSGVFAFGGNLNLIIVFLIYLLVFSKFELAIFYTMLLVVLYELFSFYFPGAYLFSFLAMLIVANFLLVNFFTNRSLYSVVALTFFSTLVFTLTFYSQVAIYNYLFAAEKSVFNLIIFAKVETIGLILNLLCALLAFYLLNFISKKVQPTFLLRTSIK